MAQATGCWMHQKWPRWSPLRGINLDQGRWLVSVSVNLIIFMRLWDCSCGARTNLSLGTRGDGCLWNRCHKDHLPAQLKQSWTVVMENRWTEDELDVQVQGLSQFPETECLQSSHANFGLKPSTPNNIFRQPPSHSSRLLGRDYILTCY